MRFARLALAAALIALATGARGAGPGDLVWVTEDYPPENYVEGGRLEGYAVETLRAMWRRLGEPEQPIEVLPWARAYHRATTLPRHAIFAIARTTERERLFKWVGPIHRVEQSLVAVAGREPRIRSVSDAARYRVGAMIEDVAGLELVRAGFPEEKLVRVRSLEQLVEMLRADRIDLVCTSLNALRNLVARDPALRFDVVPVYAVGTIDIYFGFSPDVPDALVARYQAALRAIDPERRAILKRYGLLDPQPPKARPR